MLLDVAALCEKHQINWSLSGGSIIGAVRHKGFIPWDDDIDIFMTRDNVNKFSKVFHEISDKYELAMPGDKGNIFHYPRLYKRAPSCVRYSQPAKHMDLCWIFSFWRTPMIARFSEPFTE